MIGDLVTKTLKLYKLLKGIETKIPPLSYYYKAKKEKKRKRLQMEEESIINTVFKGNYMVHNGPFKGMNYIRSASGSALLPKILGSYEEPIQEWVNQVIEEKKYESILVIGCAEGYYACGFAWKLPDTTVYAYDIDPEARKKANQLKEINNLNNVVIKAECTHEELNSKAKPNTLVFCDIEGAEDTLLDPVKVPNLRYVDMIVESHDCYVKGITEKLIKRFYFTHKIKIAVDYPFRINVYQTPNSVDKELMKRITNEKRFPYMKFLYMESIHNFTKISQT